MYDNQPTRPFEGVRKALMVLTLVARMFEAPVVVFLHRPDSFGERYLGLQSGAALLLLFFWPAFCEPFHDPTPMFIYAGLYVIACMRIRLKTFARQRRGGPQPHSRYNGTPDLGRWFRRMEEVKVKCKVEPVLVFVLGALAGIFNGPLAGFLMLASLGLLISSGFAAGYEQRRVTDMNDAYLEQRNVADGFRDMRGE